MKIDVQAGSNIPAAILLNSLDNVAVARREIAVGEASGVNGIVAAAVIPRGHKIAIRSIAKVRRRRNTGRRSVLPAVISRREITSICRISPCRTAT